MKINNLGPTGINPYKKHMNKLEQASGTTSKKTDKVEISTASKVLQQASSLEVDRQKKIDMLKSQVESGTYNLDPKEIGKGLLKFYFGK